MSAGPPEGELMDPPAVQRANRDAPTVAAVLDAYARPPRDMLSGFGQGPDGGGGIKIPAFETSSCMSFSASAFPPAAGELKTGVLTDEECKAALSAAAARDRAYLPRDDSPPTVVATLAQANGSSLELAAWHDNTGRLCTGLLGEGDAGAFGFSPFCLGEPNCGELCVSAPPLLSAPAAIGGIVSRDADYLRITLESKRQLVYPLSGPTVDDGTYRAFIAPLPAGHVQAAELFAEGERIAEVP